MVKTTFLMMYSPLQILGLRGWEWIIVLLVILLLFGSEKLPQLTRSIGRALGEFERGRREIEFELKKAVESGAAADSKLSEVARQLGIDPKGKSDDQLREELVKALQKK